MYNSHQPNAQNREPSEEENPLDLRVGVSNVPDQAGFDTKIQNKIDDMIDPNHIQMFSLEKSKYLYQIVQKEKEKIEEK